MIHWLYIPLPGPLVAWDKQLFTLINGRLTNPVADAVLPLLRNPFLWAPLYLFAISYIVLNYGKQGWRWFLFAIITVAATDFTGTNLFKKTFERLRPCADPEFAMQVRMVLGRCSGAFSFVSNHAINHFGIAAFFYFTFKNRFKYAWLAFVWAGLIAYAQVYVGVHYPFDVLCGALLGVMIGRLVSIIFNKQYRFTIFGAETLRTH